MLYHAFLAFWITTAFCALTEIEAVVEADRLDIPQYRTRAETLLERTSGVRVSLSGASPLRRSPPPKHFVDVEHCHEEARAAIADLKELLDGRAHKAIEIMLASLAQVREIAA